MQKALRSHQFFHGLRWFSKQFIEITLLVTKNSKPACWYKGRRQLIKQTYSIYNSDLQVLCKTTVLWVSSLWSEGWIPAVKEWHLDGPIAHVQPSLCNVYLHLCTSTASVSNWSHWHSSRVCFEYFSKISVVWDLRFTGIGSGIRSHPTWVGFLVCVRGVFPSHYGQCPVC